MPPIVLLVDDDPNLLSSLHRSLRKEPYDIRCATSAEEAIRILEERPVDVVVSDQDMPGIKGTELLALIHQRYPDTIRFMLTGKATLEVAVQAINEGAISRFFVKPCNVVDLALTIQQALQHRDLTILARRLLRRVQNQSAILRKIEHENPALLQVNRDAQGAILLEDPPEDFEAFMKKIHETLA